MLPVTGMLLQSGGGFHTVIQYWQGRTHQQKNKDWQMAALAGGSGGLVASGQLNAGAERNAFLIRRAHSQCAVQV